MAAPSGAVVIRGGVTSCRCDVMPHQRRPHAHTLPRPGGLRLFFYDHKFRERAIWYKPPLLRLVRTHRPPPSYPARMPTPSGQNTYREHLTTRKMRWWHESLADLMLAHPQLSQKEIAQHFGRTPATIGLIMGSDSFRAYFRQRRAKFNELHDIVTRDKILNIADASMDLMLERLDKKRDSIPLELLSKITETSLKSLGYGEQRPAQTVVQVNNSAPTLVPVAVSIEDLEAARAALRRSQMSEAPLGARHDSDFVANDSPLTIEHKPPEAAE